MNQSLDFATIMAQMNQQSAHDAEVFSKEPDNPKKIRLVHPEHLYGRELSPIELEMVRTIQSVDAYSWQRGKDGGPTTGFPLFDEGLEGGLQPGLILFAASPNVGKSAFMLQVMSQVSKLNENVYCEYHSLDDSKNEILPRYIASDQHITIGQAKNPERYEDEKEIMEKRNEGIKNLYRNVHRFGLKDEALSIEALEERIKLLKMTLPEGTRVVIGIDSFFDLTTEKNLGDKALEYIAKEVKRYTTLYDITIMCTAHLRKLNGNRRPANDDLKETNRLEYEANLICLLYNEVGIKEESADVYWLSEDEELKMPVLEVRFSKNKFGSFKGTRFYEMIPDWSYCVEAPIEKCKSYSALVHQR